MCGYSFLALMFHRRDDKVHITESLLDLVAGMRHHGTTIMELLFGKRGHSLQITEKVLNAAASNRTNGIKRMALIFNRRQGDEYRISNNLLRQAAVH